MSGCCPRCATLVAVAEACKDYETEPAPEPLPQRTPSRWQGRVIVAGFVVAFVALLATMMVLATPVSLAP